LSHDLKTPLGPILNLLKVLRSNEDYKENRELLNVIQNNVDYMKNLVNNSLDFARLNSQKIDNAVSTIQLQHFINKYVNNKKYLFERKTISFDNRIPDDWTVTVNEYEFEIVISNLIQNAIHYTHKGGTISVRARKIDGFVEIALQDTGMGMTRDQIDHAFEEFYKADGSRHDLSSTGLGLSICKRVVEKYGGKIRIESQGKGKGITVYFNLPI
jgi:signal transduction histidine kinase